MVNNTRGIGSYFLLFLIIAVCFTLLTNNPRSNDAGEHIGLAKELAGFGNLKLYWIHSAIFPLLASFLLKVYPSVKTYQLLGTFILFLTGYVLWLWKKSYKTSILWTSSPVIWGVIGSIHTVVLGGFFFLLSFIFWELSGKESFTDRKKFLSICLSGLALGLACAASGAVWPFAIFFILFLFLDKKSYLLFGFLVSSFLGFGLRFLVDHFIFGYAHFSTFRFLATNALIVLGLHPTIESYHFGIYSVLNLFIVSPLLFILLHRLYRDRKYNLLVFLLFSLVFLIGIYSTRLVYHFYPLALVAIPLMAKYFRKKEVLLSVLLSVPLIIGVIIPAFGTSRPFVEYHIDYNQLAVNQRIKEDIQKIVNDFPNESMFVSNTGGSIEIWSSTPKFILLKDEYLPVKTGNNVLREFTLRETPKFNNIKVAEVTIRYLANLDDYYPNDLYYIGKKGQEVPLANYTAVKCYSELCVYGPSVIKNFTYSGNGRIIKV